MADEVAGEFRTDHQVDRTAVALAEVEQPPRCGVRKDLFLRIPLERDADQLGVVTARPQLANELAHVNFRAAVYERDLRFTDENRLHAHLRSVPEIDDVAVEDDVFLAFEPE